VHKLKRTGRCPIGSYDGDSAGKVGERAGLSAFEAGKCEKQKSRGARQAMSDLVNQTGSENGQESTANQYSRLRLPTWAWIVCALAAVALWFVFRRAPAKAAVKASASQRTVPVSAATAHTGDIGVYIDAIGTVTPVYTVSVTSRVQGQIMSVNYREGQMVHKGDSLVEIDTRPYEAALIQAQGQLAHDQALLNEARIDLDRYKAALDRNAIAKQQYDDQVQIVAQDEGTVKNDEGTLANAKVNLVYCHIASPIDGRVGLRLVDPGNIVQANSTTTLVVITQLQPITVISSVAEDYLPQIQQQLYAGHRMTVEAFDREQKKKIATGSLLTVDNQIDTTTGTVKLKAEFPNIDNALFPSQFVNSHLLVETQHGAILIPTAAIQRNAQGAYVYVVKSDQTASIRNVTVGTTDGNVTAVQGVEPGEVVAVNGFDKLQDGIKVSVRTGHEAANSNSQGGQ
jgi:membrane fusion protein, multidrug efflux system